jgi:hypothetical protein
MRIDHAISRINCSGVDPGFLVVSSTPCVRQECWPGPEGLTESQLYLSMFLVSVNSLLVRFASARVHVLRRFLLSSVLR